MEYRLNDTVENLARLSVDELIAKMGSNNNDAEVNSWRKSLFPLIQMLNKEKTQHLRLIIELETTVDDRIDVLLVGKSKNGIDQVLIIENKQWNHITPSHNYSEWFTVPGVVGERVNPITQVSWYIESFLDHHSFFQRNNKISVLSVVNMHNLELAFKDDILKITNTYETELFIQNEQKNFYNYITKNFVNEDNVKLGESVINGTYVIGEASYRMLGQVVNQQSNVKYINEQISIANQIKSEFSDFEKNQDVSRLIVIHGAPGTGKTVVGMLLMQNFLKAYMETKGWQAVYALAKNKTLLNVINYELGSRKLVRFLPFNGKTNSTLKQDSVKLVIGDEFHRASDASDTLKLLFKDTKRIVILLQDDHQRVVPGDDGTLKNIKNFVQGNKNLHYSEYTLHTQERVGYKNRFDESLRSLLFENEEIDSTQTKFDLKISTSLTEIDNWLSEKIDEGSSKWVAPFDWEWKSKDGIFNKNNFDIEINEWHNKLFNKYWNPDPMNPSLTDQLVEWLNSREIKSLDKVASIYTCQGNEFDYVGFIWGEDLKWDKKNKQWAINTKKIKDPRFKSLATNDFEIINNIYYVLLSRAKKGIRLWIKYEDTRNHVAELLVTD